MTRAIKKICERSNAWREANVIHINWLADCQHAFRFMCFVPARFHRAVGFPFEPPQLDECSICAKKLIFMMTSTVLRPVFVVWRQKSVRFEIIHIHNNFSCPRPCLLRIHSSPDHQADRKHNFFDRAVITNCFFASFSHFDCSSSRFIIHSHQRGAQSGN